MTAPEHSESAWDAADDAAWAMWPDSLDYIERDACRDGYLAALRASPPPVEAGMACRERIISEARKNLRLTQERLDCNASDERRWQETIGWLEGLA